MKALTTALLILATASTTLAGEYVNGYTRRDGTYVQGHYRSSPDSSYNNNYSTRGNSNPYSGQQGTQSPTWNNRTPESNLRNYGDTFKVEQPRTRNYNGYGN